MEGQGAYNKYAKLPAAGGSLALPLWEKLVERVEVDPDDRTVVVADYGSSQGKNSMAPMSIARKTLRGRLGPDRPISFFHIDQPSNDFHSLFELLDKDPDRYALNDPNAFPCAIGRSFYENVLPPASVHLGWCSYAAVWLSHIPALIPGHFVSFRATGALRAEFERQGMKDWESFLLQRARELRTGGRLMVVLPALADDGGSGFENIMDRANEALAAMVADGTLTPEERGRMVLGAFPRRKCDLLAPFAPEGHFHNLIVEQLEQMALPDRAWIDYERDGDKELLATRHALFFRSVFMPSLATSLERVRLGDAEAFRVFADHFEDCLKQRLTIKPSAMHSLVQIMVLAKRGRP